MSVRVAALARLFVKDEAQVRAQHRAPLLIWDDGPKPAPFDEFRPQRTQGLGDLSGSRLADALLFEVKKQPGQGLERFAESVSVGRSVTSDIILEQKSVSRLHAFFEPEGSGWRLLDVKSRYGSFIDDRRLPEGERVPVPDGALVRFGDVALRFRSADAFFDELKRELGLG